MAALSWTGVVTQGDAYRVDSDDTDGAIRIGGVDVVAAIAATTFTGKVIVGIIDDRYIGGLSVDTGWGYSEYTPMDPDTLKVGDHDIIDILNKRYLDQVITLTISDEAINVNEIIQLKEVTQ